MRDVFLPGLAVAGVAVFVALLAVTHPVLTRMAVRNAFRRHARILLVTFGLLIGTAIICSSLSVGDTVEHIFTGDVYERLDAIDVTITDGGNGQLVDYPQSYFLTIRNESVARGLAFDGMAPVLERVMPVRNNLTGKQAVTILGLDDAYEGGFGGLVNRNGTAVSVSSLPPDGVYVNERAATDLNATHGDVLTLFWGTTTSSVDHVRVADIVKDVGKADYEHQAIVFRPLAEAQRAFSAPGLIDLIKVSAPGPAVGGELESAPLARGLRDVVNRERLLAGSGWELTVEEVKADELAQAQSFANAATQLFLVMGSFAIFAGVLLIVNVFVMLAEERKAEMGVSRAVGLKRSQLTISFVLEGSLYAGLAAFAGAAAGVALGWMMVLVFNAVFPPTFGGQPLEFYVDPGSVVLAFTAGILLTVAAVAVTSFLVSRLNIVRAIRNLPEPREDGLSKAQRWLLFGTLLGGIAFLVRGFDLFRLPLPAPDLRDAPYVASAFGLAAVNGFLLGKVLGRDRIVRVTWAGFQVGIALLALAGAYWMLTADAYPGESIGVYRFASVPLLALALGTVVARKFGARAGFTISGLLTLWWALYPPVDLIDEAHDDVAVLFVEVGLLLVFGAVLVAVFNTSPVLRFLLDRFGKKGRPVLRAAVTYPMQKKFRTGLTLSMFSLTIFSITVIAMVQGMEGASLDTYVAGQTGGYELAAYARGYLPIENFTSQLYARGIPVNETFLGGTAGIASATVLSIAMNKSGDAETHDYTLWGVDNFLIEKNTYEFLSFLPSIEYVHNNQTYALTLRTREDVWNALQLNESYVVVDRGAAGSNQFTLDIGQLRLQPGDHVVMRDATGNATRPSEFVILGILSQSLQFTQGVFADRHMVVTNFDQRLMRTAYFFQLAPGVNADSVRSELERAFFEEGLTTVDIRQEITTQFDAAERVLLLMQAYLAIGLLVGVTGLGVVTIRAVVERRQEIGVMRALGFKKRMVRNVFLLEIALIAAIGVFIGVALGIVLAQRVWEIFFASIAVFTIPWLPIATVAGAAVLFTLLATASPAVRASKLPPAETLRHVE